MVIPLKTVYGKFSYGCSRIKADLIASCSINTFTVNIVNIFTINGNLFSLIICLRPPVVSLLFHLVKTSLVEQLAITIWLISGCIVIITRVFLAVMEFLGFYVLR